MSALVLQPLGDGVYRVNRRNGRSVITGRFKQRGVRMFIELTEQESADLLDELEHTVTAPPGDNQRALVDLRTRLRAGQGKAEPK